MGKIVKKPLDENLKAFLPTAVTICFRCTIHNPSNYELRKLPFDEIIGTFHFRSFSSFDITLSGHNLSCFFYQPRRALELPHICNSILLYFLKLAKKPSLFQTTYILPWAVVPYRPILPIVHLLPILLVVRLILSLR